MIDDANSNRRLPLRLYMLAHPDSEPSCRLAEALMHRFVDPPASGGLRASVLLTPDRGDGLPPQWDIEDGIHLDAAEHSIVVVLSDALMTQTVAGGKGREWKTFLDQGLQRAPVGDSPHYVFAVAVGADGFQLADERHMLKTDEPPWADDVNRPWERDGLDYAGYLQRWVDGQVEDLVLQITVRAVQLFDPRMAESADKPPLRLFLSHAKADLKDDDSHPLRLLQKAIRDLPISGWFDAAEIPPSAKFAEVISRGLRDSSIVIAFLTDEYASRPWCQREILEAKKLGVPILVVNALEHGEPRNFPYLGNLPTICLQPGREDETARLVVGRAARETLRAMHNRAAVARYAEDDEVSLSAAPEAVMLAWSNKKRFIYPDPPLTFDELDLLKILRPDVEFVTPLVKLARCGSQVGRAIAVSVSDSGELQRYGLTSEHERSLVEELHLYLLVAGLQIAYGGALKGDFSRARNNFTLLLFELVRGYSTLVRNVGVDGLKPILNYAPWPLRMGYGLAEHRLFGEDADLIEGPSPPTSEIPEPWETLFPEPEKPNGFRFASTTPEQQLAWTRGLTGMRAQMTGDVAARIAIGGKLDRYAGLYPGVVEEAWMSLMRSQPLFLVGAFGGAAHALIEALEGDDTVLSKALELSTARRETIELAQKGGLTVDDQVMESRQDLNPTGSFLLPETMGKEVAKRSAVGLRSALNNGLDDDENRELFRSIDPPRIAELILTGLSRIYPK